jgi:hypothetical protein
MRLLKRLVAAPSLRREDLLRDLGGNYSAELALAQQLREHAALAPYPAAAERLAALADAEEAQAKRLAETIASLGGTAEAAAAKPAIGRSHWARLMMDLEAEQAAGARYLEQAIAWENEFPAIGDLLRELEHEEQRHRVLLRDLLAKSDPQALD